MSLCYRCEHRAVAHETQYGPRYECTQLDQSIHCCYMYEPVRPCILKKAKGDQRAQFTGWMVSARSCFVEVAKDMKLKIVSYGRKGNAVIWYRPTKI